MKTLIGVDLSGTHKLATELCRRLNFSNQEIHLLNVVEPVPSTGWFAPTGYVPPAWDGELKAAGEAVLQNLEKDLADAGMPSSGRVVFGQPADALLQEAETLQADLTAIGSSCKNRLESILVGSVGRALAIASKNSVLIARRGERNEGPLRLVFGTDHSPYADQCLERLLSWKLQGLESIHLVTAVHLDDWEKSLLKQHLPHVGEDPMGWIEEEIRTRSEMVAARLCQAGYKVQTHIQHGRPNEVLHHSMHAFQGDLLAVGGQGHGFVERLVLGSVALHQAVAEKYSVLILRP